MAEAPKMTESDRKSGALNLELNLEFNLKFADIEEISGNAIEL